MYENKRKCFNLFMLCFRNYDFWTVSWEFSVKSWFYFKVNKRASLAYWSQYKTNAILIILLLHRSREVNLLPSFLFYLPRTIANVLVAFLSFFADDFSLFFLLALFTLYIVNLAAVVAFFSFFDPVDLALPDPALMDATVLKKLCFKEVIKKMFSITNELYVCQILNT